MASAGPNISDPHQLHLTFTGLLYAVVIDAALHRFHHPSLSRENVLLIIALLIIIQDFFFYHQDLPNIPKGKGSLAFLLDILVLGAWYALSLATQLTYAEFLYFFFFFLLSVVIWDFGINVRVGELFTKPPGPRPRKIWMTPIPILLVGALLSVASKFTSYLRDPDWAALAFILVLFGLWRIYYLVKLRHDETPAGVDAPAGGTSGAGQD